MLCSVVAHTCFVQSRHLHLLLILLDMMLVSDIAVFVLKREVKLQPTNLI